MHNLWNCFTGNPKTVVKSVIFFLITQVSVHAADGKMPIDNTELLLLDGREIKMKRCGVHCHCVLVIRAKEILKKQCYQEEFDRLWDYAFFIPVKPGKYVADVDGDGNSEIGIATWDGGNNLMNRYGLAFSLKGNRLSYFGRKKFNLEYGEYLYKENETR